MEEVKNSYVPKDYEDMYWVYFAPGKLAYKLCKRMLFGKQVQDAEDATQEAYLRLLRSGILEKFNPSRANFGGMVFVACRSACCQMGKVGSKETKDLVLVETMGERIPGVVAGDNLLVDDGQEARIAARLDVEELRIWAAGSKELGRAKRFQNQERLIDLLLEGYTYQEIAAIFGISRASAELWVEALAEALR